jgi:hypothetical protein
VYNPKKGASGLPAQRRRSRAKQQTANFIPDPIVKRRDLDFIATLWVVEETKSERWAPSSFYRGAEAHICPSSSDESEQEEDAANQPTASDVQAHSSNLRRWHTAREYLDNEAT